MGGKGTRSSPNRIEFAAQSAMWFHSELRSAKQLVVSGQIVDAREELVSFGTGRHTGCSESLSSDHATVALTVIRSAFPPCCCSGHFMPSVSGLRHFQIAFWPPAVLKLATELATGDA